MRYGFPLAEAPRLRPGFTQWLPFATPQAVGFALSYTKPSGNEMLSNWLLKASSVPMHPELLMNCAVWPLSQTEVGPTQQLPKVVAIFGNELQACNPAATSPLPDSFMLIAAAVHWRINCNC